MTCEVFLSVVVPLLDEEAAIEVLLARLIPVLCGLQRSFEVVCVDDGSKDGTLAKLDAAARERPELVVRRLARNFGQHAAVLAGLEASRGAFVVTLDADLQNPPEEIPRLVEAFDQGHDYVGTVRKGREDSGFRRLASRIVSSATRRMSGLPLGDFGCMLRGYARPVVDQIVAQRDGRTFLPALGYLLSERPCEIEVNHEARSAGRSRYSLLRLLRLHLDLTTGFSVAPLRMLFGAGILAGAAGLALAAYILGMRVLHGDTWAAQGVFTLFALLFLFIGAQFVALGLIGEYVGRVLQTVRRRPPYVVLSRPAERRA